MDTKNIIFLVLFVVILGGLGAFFLLTDSLSTDNDESDTGVVDVSNESYVRLSESVKEVEESKKWNKNSYALAKSSIGDALKNELISEKQASALQERLEGGYLILLKDTVVNFCEQGKDLEILNELAQEVEKFKDKPTKIATARENITNYRNAINSCNSVLSLANQAYKKGATENIILQIGINTTKSHIASNNYIQELADKRLTMAREYQSLGKRIDEIISTNNNEGVYKSKILSNICNKSEYRSKLKTYSYYQNICECISFGDNCDSTKIIPAHLPQN